MALKENLRGFLIIILLTIIVIAVMLYQGPIPQDPSFHNFADKRTIFGIQNFFNVISNAAFLFVGILGLFTLIRLKNSHAFISKLEIFPYVTLFAGLLLTAVGSGYYHLVTDNLSLIWDRIPITFICMSFLSATIAERISIKTGIYLLFPLLLLGTSSVMYWYLTELTGKGDLRFYIIIQYYPMILIPLFIAFFQPRYTHSKSFFIVILVYTIAKIFEVSDDKIYAFNYFISGHTLKHIAAALAIYEIIRMLKKRHPINPINNSTRIH